MKFLLRTFIFLFFLTSPSFLYAADLSAGNVVIIDGVNDYVNVPYDPTLQLQPPFSAELWVYKEDWATPFARRGLYKSGRFAITVDSDSGQQVIETSILFCDAVFLTVAKYGRTGLSSGWHHIAVTFDNQFLKLYVDGVLRDTGDSGVACNLTYPYQTGPTIGVGEDPFYYHTGKIDEVRLYSKVLSQNEIDTHYASGAGEQGVDETDLIAGWHFDEGSGTSVADYSGNGHAGELIGGATWGPRVIPPNSVTSVTVASFGTTTATINWNSSATGDSMIYYGTTNSYGSIAQASTSATDHSLTLTGLSATTTYHFKVLTFDGSNLASSSDQTFKTLDFDPTDNVFYVAPNGSDLANGAIGSPWSLKKALSHPSAVEPGATIYLRGGTHYIATTSSQRGFTSVLTGTASEPIVVRSYTGEWAVVDGNLDGVNIKRDTIINITGAYTWYQNFEVTNSSIVGRKLDTGYNVAPNDERGGAIDDRGPGNKLINLLIHDAGGGVGAWSTGSNGEYYGNIVYNNGWDSPTGGTGHNVYSQNTNGYKHWTNNIMFNAFNMLSKLGGENESQVNNVKFEGNTFFNGANFWSGPVFRNLDTFKNYTYAYAPKFGNEESASYYDIDIRDNYLVASSSSIQIFPFVNGSTFKYNTLIATSHTQQDVLLQLHAFNADDYLTLFDVDYNTYYNSFLEFPYDALVYNLDAYAFNATQGNQATTYSYSGGNSWQDDLGFDLHSTFYDETPTPAADQVFYRKNKYDANKETVTVYNWDGNTTVSIDPSLVLDNGDTYELHNVQDYFGDVITGTYSGSPISVSMTGRTRLKPIGYDEVGGTWYVDPLEPVTFPVFGTFILENTSGTTDVASPVVSRVASTTTTSTATITWDTNEDATTVVQYGLTTSYGTASTTSDGSIYGTFYVTTHGIVLRSLSPGTTYHYRLINTDYAGNVSTSSDYTFATSPLASTVTTNAASSVTSSSATLNGEITFSGGDATQSGFAYSTISNLATGVSTSTLGAQTGTATFSTGISSLTPSTTYYFRAYVTNASTTSYGSIQNFTTDADTPVEEEEDPPVVSSGGGSSRRTAPVITATTTATTTLALAPLNPCLTKVYPTFTQNLSMNLASRGSDVLLLQKLLALEGFVVFTPLPIYESTTQTAVQSLQTKYGIVTSGTPVTTGYGNLGPMTRGFINQRLTQGLYPSLGTCATTALTTPTLPTTPSTYIFTRNLTLDSTGPDVKALQVYLNSKGFTVSSTGPGSPGNETTYFGYATRAALIKFQLSRGIVPAVGFFGPVTRGVVR
ncbi:MAG: LamG-like jellyroll fold domain-containing protein [Patescibacteria group bacterium]